jgi:hypothetical protein
MTIQLWLCTVGFPEKIAAENVAVMELFFSWFVLVANTEIVRIWGKEGEMAMQFLHFNFAFGGVIGPLVTEPFLTPNPEDELYGSNSSQNLNISALNPLG